MKFQSDILSACLRDLERDRQEHENEFESRKQDIYARVPELYQIDRRLSGTAAAVIHAAMSAGDDPEQAIARLQEENLSLQERRSRLLTENGYDADYLTYQPLCRKCWDTGYQEADLCSCVRERYTRKLTEQLSTILPIQDQNFEAFRLQYYSTQPDSRLGVSPYEIMRANLTTCRAYADSFGPQSENLLFFGSTGLGKTFLSTSIAKCISERGFSVAYDTAIQVFGSYESVKFGGVDPADALSRIKKYENADLLIIDDLGTEMHTTFTVSAFYGLLSNRLMKHRPMIINTNLLPEELSKRYSAPIASRLTGEFRYLRFIGEDIRMVKRRERR